MMSPYADVCHGATPCYYLIRCRHAADLPLLLHYAVFDDIYDCHAYAAAFYRRYAMLRYAMFYSAIAFSHCHAMLLIPSHTAVTLRLRCRRYAAACCV